MYLRGFRSLGPTALGTLLLVSCTPAAEKAVPKQDQPTVKAIVSAAASEASCSTADMDTIQWHSCNGPGSVQYGQPGTDLRAFRMDCSEGHLAIAFPVSSEADEGTHLTARFWGSETREGELLNLGDGSNIAIDLATGDPLVSRLIDSEKIEITVGEDGISVPTKTGRKLLRELVQSCRGRA